MNEEIKNELLFFKSNLDSSNSNIKKRYHYRSTINLSNGLLNNDESLDQFKKLLIEYFKHVKNSDYLLVDKMQSLKLYRNHLLPIGKYFTEKENFRTKWNIFLYALFGFVLDLIVFLFDFSINLHVYFTLVFVFVGYLRRRDRIKKNKFFSVYW